MIALPTYPGGKSGGGVAETIAGLFPRHRVYIELFLGHGGVLRRKTPAARTIGIDVDPKIVDRWRSHNTGGGGGAAGLHVHRGDALRFLARAEKWINAHADDVVVYVDPPYLRHVRTRLLYDHEFETPEQHAELLCRLCRLKCPVAVSGYWSPLYHQLLEGWRPISFKAMTRGGLRTEYVWCNFPEPAALHDAFCAVNGYRERERVKKKRDRWVRRFRAMGARERQVIAEALTIASGGEIATPSPVVLANLAPSLSMAVLEEVMQGQIPMFDARLPDLAPPEPAGVNQG